MTCRQSLLLFLPGGCSSGQQYVHVPSLFLVQAKEPVFARTKEKIQTAAISTNRFMLLLPFLNNIYYYLSRKHTRFQLKIKNDNP